MTTPSVITFPAPTADWGTIVSFAVPIDRRRAPRTTPKEIRRNRYRRQYYRRQLTRIGLDGGRWFRHVLVVQVNNEAQRRAREASKHRGASA